MKVQYVGPSFGAASLTDGKVYDVVEVDPITGALRVIDDDPDDDNIDNDPEWKPGYLYSPTAPGPADNPSQPLGKFLIVEDDEKGSLDKAINA